MTDKEKILKNREKKRYLREEQKMTDFFRQK